VTSVKTRVAVLGSGGRMGTAVCAAVDGSDDLELVARVGRVDPLEAILDAGAEVAVDFTSPAVVKEHVRFCLEHGLHCVVGTTGLDAVALRDIERLADNSSGNVVVAPNFAVGAVLMMRFAACAAKHFERAEIVERHHERKLDAPSGTAVRTARLMNEARGGPWRQLPPGELPWRGGDEGGVHVHSLRLPGSVAHQEVILGGQGETLTIRHDSIDRSSFMPGVLLAIRAVSRRPGVTVGLENLLEL
jgi:4-hydroxy-tetrahydrodipicolinate reductase